MMDSNPTEYGATPKTSRNNSNNSSPQKEQQQGQRGAQSQSHRVVKKVPPRASSEKHNIYITSKTDFNAQLKRCQDLLNSDAKEIFLHCMGPSIPRGLNLSLRLIQNSKGSLNYALNTSTINLVDELHPLCDEEDINFRHRNNSALHIKIYNRSLFDIVVPKLPVQSHLQLQSQFSLPAAEHSGQNYTKPKETNQNLAN